ncbi:uncharacterized protein ASCRUDRAFT_76835 [Ascoidea rubescens DSM 1968]|uniref:Uncharacterized protein n=1 Tax=Ascoidea rubescens DSM 1968 TaxID=1344418 RepID=A0A1D2VEF7_9ASCO|nr:hypothetical protein ASCRUDRAFT_76835 [Ascoidea rubescens DSM 1968]ODV59900.1 hypothetical protein ASCRUDRAFT_76835 [Ascoidea rubescens DSM 1968]
MSETQKHISIIVSLELRYFDIVTAVGFVYWKGMPYVLAEFSILVNMHCWRD